MTLLIRIRIILIIALIIAGVTAASVIMGISLTRRNLIETIENDMGVSGAIAEQLIAEKCRGLDDEQIKEILREEAAPRNYVTIRLIDGDGRALFYGSKTSDQRLMKSENARRA